MSVTPKYEAAKKELQEYFEQLASKHLAPLRNGLQVESVKHFLDTGTISGNFYIHLQSMLLEDNGEFKRKYEAMVKHSFPTEKFS